MANLLDIIDLAVDLPAPGGARVRIVEGVDLSVGPGGSLAIVGESGCGKSVTMLAALGLLGPGARVSGSVRFRGIELVGAPPAVLSRVRGAGIGLVVQDAASALNPTRTIGSQIREALALGARGRIRTRAEALLEEVGLPASSLGRYPHQLSGGQCQRALIAMMLARNPAILIADEPTTALDGILQAQILALIDRLARERGMALVLISHDLAVVARMCADAAVMYAGRIVERGPVAALLASPRHPYTEGLLAARRSLAGRGATLRPIPGTVPPPGNRPAGYAFAPRCPQRRPQCAADTPTLGSELHGAACFAPLADAGLRRAVPA